MNRHLYQCKTFAEQKEWCRSQFERGSTLTDSQIFLGGADPHKIIRALRRSGMKLLTIRVPTVDAGGVKHLKTLAWKVETE